MHTEKNTIHTKSNSFQPNRCLFQLIESSGFIVMIASADTIYRVTSDYGIIGRQGGKETRGEIA